MQTTYNAAHATAVEGTALACRQSRPLTLPQLEQISLVTVTGGSETDDLVITFTDDVTSQSYTLTATGSATEATLLSNAQDAFDVHDQLPMLFDLAGEVSGGDVLLTFTAKNSNRSYSISATGGTAVADPVVTNTQDPGGSGVEFGRFVRFGDEAGTFDALASDTAADDIAGVLFRTDGNHFRSTDGGTASSTDRAERGKTYSIMEQGRCYMKAEGAIARGDKLYARRALTSSAGAVGRVRATPAGGAQASTLGPVADQPEYGVAFEILDSSGVRRRFAASYTPTDGTTSVADAVDGLYDAIVDQLGAADSATNGFGITVTESSTLVTLTTDAGYEILSLECTTWADDTEAATVAATLGTADADAIYVGDFATAQGAAADGELVIVKIHMGAQ